MTIDEEMQSYQNKIAPYKEKFFWGRIYDVLQTYDEDFGFFVVHRNPDQINEVFWAVDSLDDLHRGLDLIKQDFSDFLFRHAKEFHHLMLDNENIRSWGYQYESTHIGFRMDLYDLGEFCENLPVESLTMQDIDEVMALDYAIFSEFNASKEEFIEWIQSENDEVFIIKDRKQVIGFIIIIDINGRQCYIRNLGIAENYRSQKLGYQLLMYALRQAKQKGSKKCFLWVGMDNKRAISLYEGIGFVQDLNEAESVFVHKATDNR